MSEDAGNSLASAASAYLRSAQQQPVQWQEWGEAAFAKAGRENKPVLLDIGAVWCHWCHVMDRESYEDAATAAVINEHFVAVKVDRDERPDVDTRYQAAVAAISGQGGWPLTAFLTPDGRPFFGGTYFPPEERFGRPSFRRVLLTMADSFAREREKVEESAGSVMLAIEENESFSGGAGEPGGPLLQKLIESALGQFDDRNGGFGAQPKFPHPGALDLLLDAASREGERPEVAARAAEVVRLTLRKMAAGGIHDQLAGGFHRYAVDERWIVPHFEKMAHDNSELLKNYVHAFQSFADPEFARVARSTVRWMDEHLSDRERGGFYASQDADDSLDDDGDYFTWTREEARDALTTEEFEIAAACYNLRGVGDMHHNPAKNVLHVIAGPEEIAKARGLDAAAVRELLAAAQRKLYTARLQRKTPYIDRTVYTGWNGMCVSAYLAAGRALASLSPTEFALRTLDRVLAAAWDSSAGLAHVVAYGEVVEPSSSGRSSRVAGVLEDYAFLAVAALDGWETSGEPRYFQAGQQLADAMLARFYDPGGGGFFDTEPLAAGGEPLGALRARRKPLQDAPTPAGNAVAAIVLLRLHALTGREEYRTRAQETLETFAGVVEHFGLFAASYGLALRLLVEPAVQVCVIGEDRAADELALAANAHYTVNKSVVRLRREQLDALPPALAPTLPHFPAAGGSIAVVCRGQTCLPPTGDPDELLRQLNGRL